MSVDDASWELLQRLERESSRGSATGTERAGGIAKIGGRLEELLRQAVVTAAELEGVDPLDAVRTVQPKADSVTRVTMGTLAKVLEGWSGPARDHPAVFALRADLRAGRKSVIYRAINYRNDVLHGRREPDDAAEIAVQLALWVRSYRASCGWRDRG